MKKSRFPDFPRGPDGKRLRGPNGRNFCRGCKVKEVPKGRFAWCSQECINTFHPNLVIWDVKKRDKGICQICGEPAQYPEYDHIIPFSEGGPTIVGNLRTTCQKCHKERTKQWHKEKTMRGKHF